MADEPKKLGGRFVAGAVLMEEFVRFVNLGFSATSEYA
jgi:hypothetical protein